MPDSVAARMKPDVDYSLYLVTDSTEAILGKRDLVEVVEQAILGGVTIVQYRDKTSDTGVLISTAKALHEICRKHTVPLLINDRVDVALAVGCEGVHLGQDDMEFAEARRILGESKIIGATVSSIEEARIAVESGVDYLGIGTVHATNTKKNTKDIIGVYGVRRILHYLEYEAGSEAAKRIKTVCIGGINASNIQFVQHRVAACMPSPNPIKQIDGVAIVSAIVAASDPRCAASDLSTKLRSRPVFAPWTPFGSTSPPLHTATKAVHAKKPLTHNMTNLVVQNFAANVALCVGASPIMSNNGAEAPDLAALKGALVVNMGTATPEALLQYRRAIEAYNAVGGPIVLDPVGAGATGARRDALKYLLASGHFAVIKGNQSEIMAVARASGLPLIHEQQPGQQSKDADSQQRGVDSGPSVLSKAQCIALVWSLAVRERTTVLMTGTQDYLSDGVETCVVSNGHEYLGLITGTGCTLGTTISAYLAATAAAAAEAQRSSFSATLAALLHFEIAAEMAGADTERVKGPGSFVPAFLDALYKYRMDVVQGSTDDEKALADKMRVEWVHPEKGRLGE